MEAAVGTIGREEFLDAFERVARWAASSPRSFFRRSFALVDGPGNQTKKGQRYEPLTWTFMVAGLDLNQRPPGFEVNANADMNPDAKKAAASPRSPRLASSLMLKQLEDMLVQDETLQSAAQVRQGPQFCRRSPFLDTIQAR